MPTSPQRSELLVADDELKRRLQQFAPGGDTVPGGRTGGMGQRDEVEFLARTLDAKFAADYFVELPHGSELRDGQFSHGNDEARTQNFEFIVHPRRTVLNFLRIWNAISAARHFAWETSANCGEINLLPHLSLTEAAKFLEPSEECFARGVCKGSLQDWFADAGRLPDNQDATNDCAA